jgi:serine/threonine-protein kinase ATR
MLIVPELADATLESWYTFLSSLSPNDMGPHVGPTSASFVSAWSAFSPSGQAAAKRSLDYIVSTMGEKLGSYMGEVVDLGTIPELRQLQERLTSLRNSWTPKDKLRKLLERSSNDNVTVAVQSLCELKSFMLTEHKDFIRHLSTGDFFDPLVGQILAALITAACRDGEVMEPLRLLAFECIGVLGAVDPDRCEIGFSDKRMVVLHNFTDEGESVIFVLHLIVDVLVGAFRSTSDTKYQSHLAYTIQELLQFCKFTPALVTSEMNHPSVLLKIRKRWDSLPKHVLETVTPLLEARFRLDLKPLPDLKHPIYSHQATYREWIQLWTSYLITKASGGTAQTIFNVFRSAVRNKDVGVAHHLLPHVVLNILISGAEPDSQSIRSEILAVLEDQVNPDSESTSDKKLLSAQVHSFQT